MTIVAFCATGRYSPWFRGGAVCEGPVSSAGEHWSNHQHSERAKCQMHPLTAEEGRKPYWLCAGLGQKDPEKLPWRSSTVRAHDEETRSGCQAALRMVGPQDVRNQHPRKFCSACGRGEGQAIQKAEQPPQGASGQKLTWTLYNPTGAWYLSHLM